MVTKFLTYSYFTGNTESSFTGLTILQMAFNEIAGPIVLAEPTPFGELILATINLGFLTYNNYSNEFPKPKSASQMQQKVNKGQAPNTVKRFDKGSEDDPNNPKDHVHFTDKSALYYDGIWRHGSRNLTNAEKNFLNQNGWIVPFK